MPSLFGRTLVVLAIENVGVQPFKAVFKDQKLVTFHTTVTRPRFTLVGSMQPVLDVATSSLYAKPTTREKSPHDTTIPMLILSAPYSVQ